MTLKRTLERILNIKGDSELFGVLTLEGIQTYEDIKLLQESDVSSFRHNGMPLPFMLRKKVQMFIRFYRRVVLPKHNNEDLSTAQWATVTTKQFEEFVLTPDSQIKDEDFYRQKKEGLDPSNITSSSAATNPNGTNPEPRLVTDFKRGIKRDVNAYPKFQD